MTSKALISQLEVNERRLKGIYDQLESGSLKKAVAEADKVLKKNPNLLPARVLKGLALYRSGKAQEAFSIVNEVVSCIPTDESTLNTLTYFFKDSNQKNRIVDIYEEAYKQFPNREDICTNLFYCHVKAFNYLSQQKVAIQLKKLNANNMEYGMWPMVGNVLHGVYNNDPRLVKLGEAMLTKYFTSNAILSAERIEFLVFIFEKMNKVNECYEWLDGPILKDVVENSQNKLLFDRFKVNLLLKMGQSEMACNLQSELILLNCDDVCLWRDYIDNVVELNLPSDNLNSLESVIKKLADSDINRIAINVAIIHLSISLEKVNAQLSEKFGSKTDKVVDYFARFGDRSSCIYDIYTFLCMDCFTDSERRDILNRINEHRSTLPITNNKEVERYYGIMALKRLVEGSLDINISELIETYHNVLPMSSEYGPTEIKPCDNLVRLAVSCYFDKWLSNTRDSSPLLDSVVLLKEAIDTSPANYHLRLQLSHLYGLLACQDLAIGQFNDLEIKQLMWDSLGHHYIIPALSTPTFEQRIQFLAKNLTRKQKNKLEIEDNLVTCYKLGNYGRIPEIIDFYQAIDASVMSRMSEIEVIYINTVVKSNSCDELFESCGVINLPQVESSDPDLDVLASLSVLKDYRDLTTSPDFAPIERTWNTIDKDSSFKHIILWIAQRYLVLRAYYSCAKVSMETVVKLDILFNDNGMCFSGECSNYYNVLLATRRYFVDVWSQIDAVSGSYNNLHHDLTGCMEPAQSPYYPHYRDLITQYIESVIAFHDVFVRKLPSATLSDWSQTLLAPIKTVIDQISTDMCGSTDVFYSVPKLISGLTTLCEMFAVVTMNVSMIENMSKPMRPKLSNKRKSKKKVEATGDSCVDPKFDQFRHLLTTTKFHTIPVSLITMINVVAEAITESKSVIIAASSSGTGDDESVSRPTAIFDSWTVSLDETAQFLMTKRAQLESVREIVESDVLLECVAKIGEVTVSSDVNEI